MADYQDNSNPFPEINDTENGIQCQNSYESQPSDEYEQPNQTVQSNQAEQQPIQNEQPQITEQSESQHSQTEHPETQQPQTEQPTDSQKQENAVKSDGDWKVKTEAVLTKTESGMGSAFEKTDEAVGKPIVGFSERVGTAFRKWFKLA